MEENPYQPSTIGTPARQAPRRSRWFVNALIPILIGLTPIIIALALFALVWMIEMERTPFSAP